MIEVTELAEGRALWIGDWEPFRFGYRRYLVFQLNGWFATTHVIVHRDSGMYAADFREPTAEASNFLGPQRLLAEDAKKDAEDRVNLLFNFVRVEVSQKKNSFCSICERAIGDGVTECPVSLVDMSDMAYFWLVRYECFRLGYLRSSATDKV